MNITTPVGKAALEASVVKWELVVLGFIPVASLHNCPLCALYNTYAAPDVEEEDSCIGCPIAQDTGVTYCENTPYGVYDDARYDDDDIATTKAAINELRYLIKLNKRTTVDILVK